MKKLSLSLFALLALLFMISCGGGTSEEATTEEQITEEPATEEAEEASTASGTYAIDLSASTLTWKGEKKLVTKEHYGTVDLAGGQLEFSEGDLTGGTFTIDMTTINDQDLEGEWKAKLEGHLKSDDFFAVEQYPTATLAITSAEEGGADDATHTITGDLTIRGITKPVTFPAKVNVEGDKLTAAATVKFNRAEFNVKYDSESFFENLGDKVIKDEIVLEVELVGTAVKTAEAGVE